MRNNLLITTQHIQNNKVHGAAEGGAAVGGRRRRGVWGRGAATSQRALTDWGHLFFGLQWQALVGMASFINGVCVLGIVWSLACCAFILFLYY